mmetsp:Transcript_8270/g.13630  ORF Transcript_8270/g.13630 Transcript_8270/m.13630 type:complete len:101 (+) Transcript_8270:26-328(+)
MSHAKPLQRPPTPRERGARDRSHWEKYVSREERVAAEVRNETNKPSRSTQKGDACADATRGGSSAEVRKLRAAYLQELEFHNTGLQATVRFVRTSEVSMS